MRMVWDPIVRISHWLLVASVVTAWFTRTGPDEWHERAGYVALSVVAVRTVWGWLDPTHARFANFVRPPGITLLYAHQLLWRRERRHVGHNPLGGWMIVALLVTVALVATTGWLYTTDRFWGVAWVGNLHTWLTDLLLVLVALHLAGVLYSSHRHGENLIASMLHGRKREDD